MATNLHIDEKLLAKAVKVGGRKTKRDTVNEALAEYVQRRAQTEIIKLFGTFEDEDFWEPAPTERLSRAAGRNGKKK